MQLTKKFTFFKYILFTFKLLFLYGIFEDKNRLKLN